MKSSPFNGSFKIKYPFMVKDSGYASGYHCGIDLIPVGSDKTILPINDGEVVTITTNDAYGNSVVQSLPDGRFVRYSHLKSIAVSVGDTLKSGETKIGVMGTTGHSTGEHLDLRISKYPYHTNNVSDYSSPADYLGFENIDELVVNLKESGENMPIVFFLGTDDLVFARRVAAKVKGLLAPRVDRSKYPDCVAYIVGGAAEPGAAANICGETFEDTAAAYISFMKG